VGLVDLLNPTPRSTDKAVILAAGLGTRMRRTDGSVALDDRQTAVAATGVKALIPVGRPFLDYVLSSLADAGYRRVCLVIGPKHDALRQYYQDEVRPTRLRIEFAVQQQPKGTADAVAAAETFAGDDPFLVINSDNFYPVEAIRALRDGDTHATALFDQRAMLSGGNLDEGRLRRFAVGRIDDRGFLAEVIEKPDETTWASLPRPIWVSMNCWRFGPTVFDACRAIGPSARGELEITDAVRHLIDLRGEPFRALTFSAPVLDLTSQHDIEPIRRQLADREVHL